MSLAVIENEQLNFLDHQSEEKEQIDDKPEAVVYPNQDIPNEAGDYEEIAASDEDSTEKESNVEDNNDTENDEETNDKEEMGNEGKIGCLIISSKRVLASKGAHTWSSYLKVKCNQFLNNFDSRLMLEKIPKSSCNMFGTYQLKIHFFPNFIFEYGNF